ncbi:MAG: hypothetical protein RSC55_09765, partial [Oscillospiraceae bacterium]
MKKILCLILALVLVFGLMAGCASKPEAEITPPPSTEKPETTPDAKGDMLGLSIIADTSGSTAPADGKDGIAKTELDFAAVIVDSKGVIKSCVLDGMNVSINFSNAGKLTSDLASEPQSKNEIGANYGLAKVSSIGKEWNEQAAAFATYAVGKTVADLKGLALNDKGAPKDADLASSVTVHVSGFTAAVEKAVANAKVLGSMSGDKLGLSSVANIAKSIDAKDGKDGLAQAYVTVCAETTGADGKVTACVFDAVQANVNFNAKGEITSDIAAAVPTKNELGT